MPINGPNIIKTKLFEQSGRRQHPLGMPLKAAGQLENRGHMLQKGAAHIFGCGIKTPRQQTRQIMRSEEHTSELQSRGHLVCRLLLEKKKKQTAAITDDYTKPTEM